MRKSFVPVRIITLWATFFLSAIAQQNIILNGDFEAPSSDGLESWSISSGDILRTEDGYRGWGLTLASTSATTPAVITQPLNATSQRTYQISFWAIYHPPTESNVTDPSQRLLTIQCGSNGHWNIDAPAASWKSFIFEAHDIGTDGSLSFNGYDLAGGSFIVDDVSLLDSSALHSPPTPSPSSSSPAPDDPGAVMGKVNVIWGVVGSIIAAVASVATIYMCLDRWRKQRRYKRLNEITGV